MQADLRQEHLPQSLLNDPNRYDPSPLVLTGRLTSPFQSRAAEDGPGPKCKCGDAVQKTVLKEGPTKGKLFWTCCVGKLNGGCDFFEWADDPPPNARAASTAGGSSDRVGDTCYKVSDYRIGSLGP
jgi:DNA topoisomerase-3